MGCCSSETWPKVIAIFQIIKASISLLDGAILLAFGSVIVLAPPITEVRPAGVTFIILEELILILSTNLHIGTSSRIIVKCRIWLVVQAIFVLLANSFFLAGLTFFKQDQVTNFIGVVGLVFNANCVWAMYSFIICLNQYDMETNLETTLANVVAAFQHCFVIIGASHNNSLQNDTTLPNSLPLYQTHPISRGCLAKILHIKAEIKIDLFLRFDIVPEQNTIRLKHTAKNSCLAFIILNPERPYFGETCFDVTTIPGTKLPVDPLFNLFLRYDNSENHVPRHTIFVTESL
ncbi:hypothetical protein Fcan01_15831 [Folsomia candida]|uniref:Uncharacterized protein n=1 Tax=Folsomia candida TaxID=158441 RepID=A0A226DW56_FOLCA|nr:hypothetical protein Fcan01_15831 [Folsomia candida]